jgi:hypothetical protein
MPSQAQQNLSAVGQEVDPIDRREETRDGTVLVAQQDGGLAVLEQNPDPAGAWNRNAARFGDATRYLGTTSAQDVGPTANLTDEAIDDLILVLTDDPTVPIGEIDAARERLLADPAVPEALADMDPEETMRLLGSADPVDLANFDILRDDFGIRRLVQTALGDRVAAIQAGDYIAARDIEQAQSELRRHPRAFTALRRILAGRSPEAVDLAASIVILNPAALRRMTEILNDGGVDPSIRERGLEALPQIAREVPELRGDIREFLSERRQTDADPNIREKALAMHHRLGFGDYGEATELVGGLSWTLRNDPDTDLRVSAVYHLAQVAREIRSGSSYPDHYPVELGASDGEALIRHIREDIFEPSLIDADTQPEVAAAIAECLATLP